MASPNKKDELLNELTQPSSRQKWLAIAYAYVHNKSDAEDVLQETILDLSRQNTNGVRDVTSFLMKVIINKAKTRFNNNSGSSEAPEAAYYKESETTDTLFTQMEMEAVMNAIKQHRDRQDFILFEMHVQGYDYEEIASLTGEKAGTLRHRMFNLRNWIKRFLGK